jgi:hypothetical protein
MVVIILASSLEEKYAPFSEPSAIAEENEYSRLGLS